MVYHFALQYKKRQKLIDAQKKLEEQLRKEEDAVIDEMLKKRSEESKKIQVEIQKEWEVKLKELTARFDQEMGKKSKKMRDSEKKVSLYDTDQIVEHSLNLHLSFKKTIVSV